MVLHQGKASVQNGLHAQWGSDGMGEGADHGVPGGAPGASRFGTSQALLLLAAPVIGLLYILLLPLGWLIAVGAVFVRKSAVVLFRTAAGSISFGWRPVEAYLAGRRNNRTRR